MAAALLAAPLDAAPLNYQVNMTAGSESPTHPLAGATLQLNISWDATALPPLNSSAQNTLWPVGNSIGSLTVIGSAASDGIYEAVFSISPTLSWYTTNDFQPFGDSLRFPQMSFQVDGDTVSTGLLQASFASSFFNAPYPFLPKAFDSAEATWNTLQFTSSGPISGMIATVVSGFAVEAPEPATVPLIAIGAMSLVPFGRRRK